MSLNATTTDQADGNINALQGMWSHIEDNKGISKNPWLNLGINAGAPIAASWAANSVKNRTLRGMTVAASVLPGMATDIAPNVIDQFKNSEWADLVMTLLTGASGGMAVVEGFLHDKMDVESLQSFGVLLAIFSAVGMFEEKQEGKLDEAVEKERSGIADKVLVEKAVDGKWIEIPVTDVEAGDEIRFTGTMIPVDGEITTINEESDGRKYIEVNSLKATGQQFTSLLMAGSEVLQGSAIMQDNGNKNTDKKDIITPTITMRAGKSFKDSSVVHSLSAMIEKEQEIENNPELKKQEKAEMSSKVKLERNVNYYILGLMLPMVLGVAGYEMYKGLRDDGQISHKEFRNAIRKSLTMGIRMAPCPIMAVPFIDTMTRKYMLDLGVQLVHKAVPERLASVDTVVFDLTGTITNGTPELTMDRIITVASDGFEAAGEQNKDARNILLDAALLERFSTHPIAYGLHELANRECDGEYSNEQAVNSVTINKKNTENHGGISGTVDGRETRIGNIAYFEKELADMPEAQSAAIRKKIDDLAKAGSTAVIAMTIGSNGKKTYSVLGFNDRLHPEAVATLKAMKGAGKKTVLMTGDNHHRAEAIQRAINADGQIILDEVVGNCLPEDKAKNIDKMRSEGKIVAMVGDGLNDAPALKAAHTSIAVRSGGSEVSQFAAKGGTVNHIGDVGRIMRLNRLIAEKTRFFTIAASIWVGVLSITEFLPFKMPTGIVSLLHEGPTALMLMLTANAARNAVVEVYKDIEPDIEKKLPPPMSFNAAMDNAKNMVKEWAAAKEISNSASAEDKNRAVKPADRIPVN